MMSCVNVICGRFFFHALNADENELCGTCKEEMRQAFYVKGDEEEALKWRPGKVECCWRNCKHYAMEIGRAHV